MKKLKFVLLLIFASQMLFGQKKKSKEFFPIDQKALLIPDSLTKTTDALAKYFVANFKTDNEKSRAIYIWVVCNVQYDIDNMFAINFYEKKEDKISKPLKTKKGICENYASLFTDICLKSGLKSYVIEGYTIQNGFADYIPHAWSATLIDSSWYLFDPTWGSGYVEGGRFHTKINNDYFKVAPSSLISSHMPFDYLWQFLNYPITNQEFYEGKTQQNKMKPYFNFMDSIKLYENQSNIDQLKSSAYRVEKNGVKNSLIFDRLQHLKIEIENDKIAKENDRLKTIIDLYNSAIVDYNEGINAFNEFINYRNTQFTPPKTDIEIQKMLDISDSKLTESKIKLGQISKPDVNTANLIIQLTKSLDAANEQLKAQNDWLKLYLSKGKIQRKAMFYK